MGRRPAHAHAVAAGFLARAGDLDAARRALDTVVALDDWRTDRSYLWSVFVGGMATAAVAPGRPRCARQLLAELSPVADACGVNGALVCFMGSNAHRAGMLAAALGRPASGARRLLTRRWPCTGGWAPRPGRPRPRRAGRARRRARRPRAAPALLTAGRAVERRLPRRSAHLRDLKGLRDLAVLLAGPGSTCPAWSWPA